MHPTFYIRLARVEEAAALSDLCFRSKAVWGYDPEFMALMLAAGDVWVATAADGQIAGVVALAPGDEPDALDLNKLVRRASPYPQRRRPGATRARRRRGSSARRRAADDPG